MQDKNTTISSLSEQESRQSSILTFDICMLSDFSFRRLEAETNEKLAEVYQKILQAGVDKNQSDRDVKLKETLSNLQRMFPGTV